MQAVEPGRPPVETRRLVNEAAWVSEGILGSESLLSRVVEFW